MSLLIFISVLTILLSATCSLLESVLYSCRSSTLIAAESKGKYKDAAKKLLQMRKQISDPIAAILILNTVANTAGATIAGMLAINVLGIKYLPVFSIAFTLGILFFSEILPKTIGALHWKILWPFIVTPISVMQWVLKPFIKIIRTISNSLSGNKKSPLITEDEILAMISVGAKEGEISKGESNLVHNILELESHLAESIMTPRTVIFSLDEALTVDQAFELAKGKGFSRIPTYRGERENIHGYIIMRDLAEAKVSQSDQSIGHLVKDIFYVSRHDNCWKLLNSFLRKKQHIAMVNDTYDGIAGLITLEDLLETMLGQEIVDEKDKTADLQKMAIDNSIGRKSNKNKFSEPKDGQTD